MKLGLIAFANDSGLGNQTRNLAYMLRPDVLMVIDSSSFSKNTQQHLEWYKDFVGYIVHGFPSDQEVRVFLRGLSHLFLCENPLNKNLLYFAKRHGIKTYIQSNYEFCDHLNTNMELPTTFCMPSYWMIDEMKTRFPKTNIVYLPPPIDMSRYKEIAEQNIQRYEKRKHFIHIVGTLAVNDRNGTLDLLEAVKKTKQEYILTIYAQRALPDEYMIQDKRVQYHIGTIQNECDMYKNADALLLPRRYGGLSLTTNEALASAVPVYMPNISPNNKLLPHDWLYNATVKGTFITRTLIDIYESNREELALCIDRLATSDMIEEKKRAQTIAYEQFTYDVLREKYQTLW